MHDHVSGAESNACTSMLHTSNAVQRSAGFDIYYTGHGRLHMHACMRYFAMAQKLLRSESKVASSPFACSAAESALRSLINHGDKDGNCVQLGRNEWNRGE